MQVFFAWVILGIFISLLIAMFASMAHMELTYAGFGRGRFMLALLIGVAIVSACVALCVGLLWATQVLGAAA